MKWCGLPASLKNSIITINNLGNSGIKWCVWGKFFTVSRALTVCGVMSFFTVTISPVLQASKSSRSGSLASAAASKFTDRTDLMRLDIVCNSQIRMNVSLLHNISAPSGAPLLPPFLSRHQFWPCRLILPHHRHFYHRPMQSHFTFIQQSRFTSAHP